MNREDCKVGMRVYFGRERGERTLGEIIKINRKSAKIKTLESRGSKDVGSVWNVDYNLLQPAIGVAAPAKKGVVVNSFSLALTEKAEPGHYWHGNPKYAERKDHYFAGTVVVNGKEIPTNLHVMTADGSIVDDVGGWYVTAELNRPKKVYDLENNKRLAKECDRCCGGDGIMTRESKSETAVALAQVLFPWLAGMGYQIKRSSKKGGWWLFDCFGTVIKEEYKKGGWWHTWTYDIDCPVHGRVSVKYREGDAD